MSKSMTTDQLMKALADHVLTAVVMDANSGATIQDLEKQITELNNSVAEILALPEDDLDDATMTELEELENQIAKKTKILEVKKRIAENSTSRGRRTSPARQPVEPAPTEPKRGRRGETVPAAARNGDDDKRHGFKFFGEFANTVIQAGRNNGGALERLENVATTYGSEGVGADGGYLVPPDFSTAIWQKVRGEDSLLARCAQFTTGRNSLTFPKDETTPWENSSGIRVFWEGEGDQGTASKPKFETTQARLNKLMALVNVTEELMEDAPGLDSYLRFWTPVKMTARINTAIVRGTGAGQPLGILNASSLVTISKENSQDAASILFPNINKMWNRIYAPLRSNAIWLINQEIEPQLEGMQFIPANEHGAQNIGSNIPVYLPAGGVADMPFARLKGRPVIPVQPASQLGTIGDIILTDLSQYMALTKGSGIQEDTSIHLYFDQAIQVLRFIFRVTGQPIWNSVITPENGSNTYSWAVALETRA